jgi:hypothetical protein
MKLDLKIRNLETGITGVVTFDSTDEAMTWLKGRPKGVDVLGVASHHIPADINAQLKAALRPLDEEELALERKLDETIEARARALAEKRQKEEHTQSEEQRKAISVADPNRPLPVRYRFNAGLSLSDPLDKRTITEEARVAVMAWVAERNDWVKGRGLCVGEATMQVWPGPIPAEHPGGERVFAGTFIPVTAAKPDQKSN